jgi:hypothetical protein
MLNLFAQATPPDVNFWARPSGSSELIMMMALAFIVGVLIMVGLMNAPVRLRRPIVIAVTFLSGLFFVVAWLWPTAQAKQPDDIPLNAVEGVSFWLQDATGQVGKIATIVTSFLLGLGVFSILRIHVGRLVKQQKDWGFSLVLLFSMFLMCGVGYWEWVSSTFALKGTDFNDRANWQAANYFKFFLFDGLLQKMDGAMFSIIAFYIMSAAYRAFRVRSVEATILLAAALIMMLNLLALTNLASTEIIKAMAGPDYKASFLYNLHISEIAGFVRNGFQVPSIRAIDFGIGIGALAMGLRLWLSLDKGGVTG